MLRISHLTLNNLGPFEKVTFDFSIESSKPDIHIFVGANGTGKTTILHSLASCFDYFEPDHKEHISNKISKRFHFFDEDDKKLSKSYSHSILQDQNGNVVDKIINYGCKNCGNIHQNFDKTKANNSQISKHGNSYDNKPLSSDLTYFKNALIAKDLNNKKLKFAAFAYSGYRFIETETIEISDKNNFNPLKLALEFVKKDKESEKGFKLSNWIVSRYSKAAIEETLGNLETSKKYKETLNNLINSINLLTNNEYTIKIETNPWRVGISYCGKDLEFDVLPDGLRSILSWLGDILMRLDEIPWENKSIPITHQNIILFLDEIEVHLHPTWQYKILSVIRDLLPNAQIFISTHSPFILNSIDNAKIYILNNENCNSKLVSTNLSETGWSITHVLENILNAKNPFGIETMQNLKLFNEIDAEIVIGNIQRENEFKDLIKKLSNDGEEVISVISSKLFRLNRISGKNYLNGEDN